MRLGREHSIVSSFCAQYMFFLLFVAFFFAPDGTENKNKLSSFEHILALFV